MALAVTGTAAAVGVAGTTGVLPDSAQRLFDEALTRTGILDHRSEVTPRRTTTDQPSSSHGNHRSGTTKHQAPTSAGRAGQPTQLGAITPATDGPSRGDGPDGATPNTPTGGGDHADQTEETQHDDATGHSGQDDDRAPRGGDEFGSNAEPPQSPTDPVGDDEGPDEDSGHDEPGEANPPVEKPAKPGRPDDDSDPEPPDDDSELEEDTSEPEPDDDVQPNQDESEEDEEENDYGRRGRDDERPEPAEQSLPEEATYIAPLGQ